MQPLLDATASRMVCQVLGYWTGKVCDRTQLLIQQACQEQQLVVWIAQKHMTTSSHTEHDSAVPSCIWGSDASQQAQESEMHVNSSLHSAGFCQTEQKSLHHEAWLLGGLG